MIRESFRRGLDRLWGKRRVVEDVESVLVVSVMLSVLKDER